MSRHRFAVLSIIYCVLAWSSTVSTMQKPKPETWIGGRHPDDKLNLISWLVDGCFYYGATPTGSQVPVCPFQAPDQDEDQPEYASFDGFYNNVFKTDLGAVDTPLLRRVPPAYEDGTYEPVKGKRINPLTASQRLMTRTAACGTDTEGRTIACGSKTGKSAFLVFFGQQVVEEILDAQRAGCPPEYFNIPIPQEHEFQTSNPHKSVMPLLRSRYAQSSGSGPGNPRQQLNEITPWMDGGLVYGTSKGWSDVLRTFSNGTFHPYGKLASEKDEGYFPALNTLRLPMANPPPPAYHSDWIKKGETDRVNRFFVLGNPRGNENAFLLSFGVVLFRWHNQFAEYLHVTRPGWSGERIFQEARKWATATYNSIVYYDWLPQWLGEELEPYRGYDPALDPQIEQFFQTAAMRFGHTLVTPGAYMRDYACTGCKRLPFYGLGPSLNVTKEPGEGAVRTCNIFWRPQEPLEMKHKPPECLASDPKHRLKDNRDFADIDRLLMGMASQRAEREDNMIVEDLRGRVFGPLEFSRRDLMAINIQRGRDHGTPDYNTARAAFGLERIQSIEDYIRLTNTATPKDILETMVEIHKDKEEPEVRAWSNIDVWTGGILETSDRPGPLFRAVIKDQFMRIRGADRFWFENTKWEQQRFKKDQIERIKSLKVFDMIVSVTRMTEDDIQPNPFRVPDDRDNKLTCLNVKEPPLSEPKHWRHEVCHQTMYDVSGNLNASASVMAQCRFLVQLDSEENPVENCTTPASYDYFTGSEVSFILTYTLLGLFIAVLAGAGLPFIVTRSKQAEQRLMIPLAAPTPRKPSAAGGSRRDRFTTLAGKLRGASPLPAHEWQSPDKESLRAVALVVASSKLEVLSLNGELLRELSLESGEVTVLITSDSTCVAVKDPREYDVVLKFDGAIFQQQFLHQLELQAQVTKTTVRNFATLSSQVVTKAQRLAKLDKFFRAVFESSEEIDGRRPTQRLSAESEANAQDVRLTRAEFAAALGMDSSSSIIVKIFDVADQDGDGFVTFLDFFTMLSIFKKGSTAHKFAYIFRVYDTDGDGALTRGEFEAMLRSVLALLAEEEPEVVYARIAPTIEAELGNKLRVTLNDFQRIFTRNRASFGGGYEGQEGGEHRRASYMQQTRQSVLQLLRARDNDEDEPEIPSAATSTMAQRPRRHWLLVWFEIQRLRIIWLTFFNCITAAIFAERWYYYSLEREHRGLRQIAGLGVSITRGAASVQMWCYAVLLLTMCRNVITRLRESFVARYVPLESFMAMHKYVACVALFFTVLHIVGHAFNFYNISTQTADDLACIFRDYFRPTHVLPKFHYWAFQTVTGLSGILLTLHAAVIFTFATPIARRHAYRLFWITHQSYPLWYGLTLLHGSGQLVQAPLFFNFLIGPLLIFVYDKLITFSRQFAEISVLEADLLPSNVTRLKFVRPTGFEYRAGQWVRIACSALNGSEFHPFTLTSAPHESFLSLHIRAVGPFTWNVRRTYENSMPNLYLDGPYGEAHQDWDKFEVAILVGGGIGVTPFASILKELSASGSRARQCKKVYFVWVTRSQRQFEWLVEIIKEAEVQKLVSVYIYITQSNAQFDLRTLLLYVLERDFQKVNNRSLLTGLKSTTHFGRPDFTSFFKAVKKSHGNASKFGVFACGPPPMTKSVEEACQKINLDRSAEHSAEFRCYAETF